VTALLQTRDTFTLNISRAFRRSPLPSASAVSLLSPGDGFALPGHGRKSVSKS